MSIYKLIRLNFGKNPAHFGEVGIGLEETTERVRSDTLFSAWASAYARLFGKNAIEGLLERFKTQSLPPFRLSSTFIYRHNGKNYIDYLPKPIERPKNYPDDDLTFAKTYKKLGYLPLEVWQRWYQGKGFTQEDLEELENHAQNSDAQTGLLGKAGTFDYNKSHSIYTTPKVAIDRTSRATNFYHTGFVQFSSESDNQAGLYFLIEFSDTDDNLQQEFLAALALLGEEGIGGERSSGAGHFTLMTNNLDLPQNWQQVIKINQHTHYSLISLFWQDPRQTDLQNLLADEKARYSLQERGGWISSSSSGRQLRRQMIRMFQEGSIFSARPQGQLADVTPLGFAQHRIYRNGIALSLPVRITTSI